jgi:tetratricopeptide (TPR) repeat protein
MRTLLFVIIFLHTTLFSFSQTRIDSALHELANSKEDTNKVKTLNWLAFKFVWNDPKKAIQYALPALSLTQKLKYKKGELNSLFAIGEAFAVTGNHDKAIELKFKGLKMAEEMADKSLIGQTLLNIAAGYFYQGDYERTISYTKKAMQMPEFYDKSRFNQERANGFLGEAFFKLNKLDSALYYIQRAYEIDLELDRHWAVPYFYLAHIHAARKHYDLALQYYKLGLEGDKPKKDVVDGHLGIATAFHKMGKTDSALFYVQKTIEEGTRLGFQEQVLEAATIAKNIYKSNGLRDSAFFYQELVTEARDSLYNQEKLRAVQNLTFNEQLRQLEVEANQLQEKEERKHNLQYAAIALGIVTFLVLFFLLSNSIIANQRLIKFLGILGLLIVFEFLNLLLHPFLDKITNHQPVLMLLAMVCIAALLIPLHHKLEHWITHKMVEKNKKIRLAAAKKTIATLEGENH